MFVAAILSLLVKVNYLSWPADKSIFSQLKLRQVEQVDLEFKDEQYPLHLYAIPRSY